MHPVTEILHPDTGDSIVRIRGTVVEFQPEGNQLEEKLRLFGIFIPTDQRPQFNNKKIVRIHDEGFAKAFLEIYFPNSLQPSGFRKLSKISK